MSVSRLQEEIKQTKPFRSVEQEAWLSILRSADQLKRWAAPHFEAAGLTEQQYNVLRILRGAGLCGLPTLAIAERLIEHTPGITRLIDRLESKGLVRRERPERDRRQVYCFITAGGLSLLESLDPEMDRRAAEPFAGVPKVELKSLILTLEKIRTRSQ